MAQGGLVGAVRTDLKRLHETWMELVFPRQLGADDSVLGKWTPDTTSGWVGYRLWGLVGGLLVAALYPLTVVGYAIRFNATRVDNTATRLGVVGVVVLSLLVWGALTALARLRFSAEGFLAVAAAAVVATVSAGLAVTFTRVAGRKTTVLVAYPLGMTALFLPPVVAALYSPALAALIFPGSESLAAWFLDNVFAFGGLGEYLRTNYELDGLGYIAMWLGIAIPLGWLLGGLTTLAAVVRPAD